MGKNMKKTLKALLCAALAGTIFLSGLPAFAQSASDSAEPSELQITQSMVEVQEGMRAAVIKAGVDFAAGEQTAEELSAELSALMEEIGGYHMNAVIIDTSSDDETAPEVKP